MPLQWTDDLSVGVDLIDDQHRELIDSFNRLLAACHRHEAREMVPELFDFLDRYVRDHFAAEEQRMAETDYPQREDHQRLHRDFIRQLDELKGELDEDGASMSLIVHLNEVLLRWFINHIKRVDRQLGAYLQTRPD